MNKPSINSIRKQAQAGFTLIELIVVIVILGILAATALPKFSSIGGDARLASLNAAKGALASVAASAHGQYLINPVNATVTYETSTVTFATTVKSGYPMANAGLADAAGLTVADYTIIPAGHTADANSPTTSATEIAVIPNSIAGTPRGLTCYLSYTEPTAVNTQPAIAVTGSADACK